MFCELKDRLYRSRDVFASALAEYDDTCGGTTPKWRESASPAREVRKVPRLETYRQMAVRQQKVKD